MWFGLIFKPIHSNKWMKQLMSDSDSLNGIVFILASIHSLFKGSIQPSNTSYSSPTDGELRRWYLYLYVGWCMAFWLSVECGSGSDYIWWLATLFSFMIPYLKEMYGDTGKVIIMDNVQIHCDEAVRNALERQATFPSTYRLTPQISTPLSRPLAL